MAIKQKEIDALRARIIKLEKQQEKEAQESQALEDTRQNIMSILEEAGVSFEAFIRFNYKSIRRIVAKIEREESNVVAAPEKRVRKKTTTKKRRRKATRAKTTIKIPAGKYTNVPSAPDTLFEVKDKGPRPKLLKAYAEEVGLETFFEECRID